MKNQNVHKQVLNIFENNSCNIVKNIKNIVTRVENIWTYFYAYGDAREWREKIQSLWEHYIEENIADESVWK